MGNPNGNITDIAAVAAVAHQHGIPVIVDNTIPSPYLHRPFEHGADIVIHALTKYLGGHGNSLGGIIVDSGKFPWAEHKARFKRLNEPDVSYHGVVYTEALGAAAYIGRARVVPLRNMGAALSPFNAFLILQGIETLALRMDRTCDNALAIAQFLQKHPKVAKVNYAALPDSPDYALAQKYMGGKGSGLLTFELKSDDPRAAGARFLDGLQLVLRLVNIGDTRIIGAEISFAGQGKFFGYPINTFLGYTRITPTFRNFDCVQQALSSSNENILKYRFQHTVKGDIEATIKRFRLGVTFQYYSHMEAIDEAFNILLPGVRDFRENHKNGDLVLDARLAFNLSENSSLSFLVKNLLNREYMLRPALIEAPRNFTLRYAWTLKGKEKS